MLGYRISAEILFNKIWVIESLRISDVKTGSELFNNTLTRIAGGNPDLHIELAKPETKNAFFDVLEEIEKQALAGLYPMIHIECHGSKDGLQLTSGDFIKWDELREALIRINTASKMNTVIVMGACNGIHLIKVSTNLNRAPYWAIIGPEREVYPNEVLNNFTSFYTTFFESLDGDAAIDALNGGFTGPDRTFHFHTCVGLFKRAYSNYHKRYCKGKGKRVRLENLLSQAMQTEKWAALGVSEARVRLKSQLAKEHVHFNEAKRKFFMIDLHPENAVRFSISYDDIISSMES